MVDLNPTSQVQQERNWVLAASALKCVRDGIAPYVDYNIQRCYEAAFRSVCKVYPAGVNYLNENCSLSNLLPAHRRSNCPCRFNKKCFCREPGNRRPCPNHFCSLFYDRIVADHLFLDPNWENTDPSRWSQDHWEYAKCFIPTVGDKQVHSAEDSELSSLINICLNHKGFQGDMITRHNLRKCRNVRNQILHSRSMQITDEQLQKYIDVMIGLLQSLSWPSAEIAAKKLIEIQQGVVPSFADYGAEAKEIATKEIRQVTELTLGKVRSTTLRLLQKQTPDSTGHFVTDEKYSKYSERREAVLLEDIAQRIIREAEQKSGKEAGSDVVCRNVTSILGKLTDTGFYTGDINKEESDTIILETNKLFRELLDKKLLQTEPDDADSEIPDSASDMSCMHRGSVTEFGEEPLMFPDTHGTSQDQKTKRKTTDVKYESLMSMRELKNLLLTEGKTSSTLIEECDKICKFIKQLRAMDIINVWPGYKLEASNEIVFVVFTNKKIHLYLKWVVEIRVLGQGNEARKTVMELEEQNPLAKEMEVKISSVIDKYSAMLIKKHTFLSAISASSVLSQKQEKGEQEKSPVPCIVLYVLVKSIVFLTEERFPDKLDGIQVDVREGVFRFCGLLAGDFHERLRMGCKITSGLHPEKFGTLGGFIEHPEYGLCGFTCAHVCLNEEEMFELKKRKVHKDFQPEHYVFQPENGDVNKVGRLLRLIYREGNDQETGLDVAMFKIERRAPDAGIFPDKENNSATELRYDSGKVWGKLGIPSDEEKKVQKFGFVTGHTYGKIQFTNSVVSEIPYHFDIMKLKEKSITSCLFKQYHIKATNRDIAFSKVGDSGSLVFMEDEEHDVRCIGMVVGVIEEDNSAFVTPITDILSELGVNSLKFFNHSILFATLDRRIDELENRIQDRMQQMEQRILDAVSSVTENKTASK